MLLRELQGKLLLNRGQWKSLRDNVSFGLRQWTGAWNSASHFNSVSFSSELYRASFIALASNNVGL